MIDPLRRLMRLLDRRPSQRVLEDAERYRQVLGKASEAVPDDPRMIRVLREFERAEERLKARDG
jgi:hypothetical protein